MTYRPRLSAHDVKRIHRLADQGISAAEIARRMDIPASTVEKVRRGATYKRVIHTQERGCRCRGCLIEERRDANSSTTLSAKLPALCCECGEGMHERVSVLLDRRFLVRCGDCVKKRAS